VQAESLKADIPVLFEPWS